MNLKERKSYHKQTSYKRVSKITSINSQRKSAVSEIFLDCKCARILRKGTDGKLKAENTGSKYIRDGNSCCCHISSYIFIWFELGNIWRHSKLTFGWLSWERSPFLHIFYQNHPYQFSKEPCFVERSPFLQISYLNHSYQLS